MLIPESCPEFFPQTNGILDGTDTDQYSNLSTERALEHYSCNKNNPHISEIGVGQTQSSYAMTTTENEVPILYQHYLSLS